MSLSFVKPGPVESVNLLFYGPEGSGKTTGALSAPGPVLYLNAEGPNAGRYGHTKWPGKIREVTVTSARVFDDAIAYLDNEGKDVKTVVLDSISEIHVSLMEEQAKGGKFQIQYYGDVNTEIRRFARHIRDLPINLVLVAHETFMRDEETGVIERVPFTGTSKPGLGKQLTSICDVVAYCKRTPPESGDGDAKYMASLVHSNQKRAKHRFEVLGNVAEVDVTAWTTKIREANGDQAESRKRNES